MNARQQQIEKLIKKMRQMSSKLTNAQIADRKARLEFEQYLKQGKTEEQTMFTRQHYKAIAEIVKEERTGYEARHQPSAYVAACNAIAESLMYYFAADNPRFDRDQFLIACGI